MHQGFIEWLEGQVSVAVFLINCHKRRIKGHVQIGVSTWMLDEVFEAREEDVAS